MQILCQYSWPGNVRELKFFIERLVVIAKEKVLTEQLIQKYWQDREVESIITNIAPLTTDLSSLSEEDRITAALAKHNSNITSAAKALGMDRSTLYRKLKNYKIEVKKTY